MLRQRGEDRFDVVFTGGMALPHDLMRLVQSYGLYGRVHVLGRVDRETLAALYKRALATLVPSLYEQGSFPMFEAIHWNCPAACSNIPSLVEQWSPLEDAALFFDPHDEEQVADIVLQIDRDPEEIRRRQWEASRKIWERTWTDAAREWLVVFKEAAARPRKARNRNDVIWRYDVAQLIAETDRRELTKIAEMSQWV